MTIRQVIEEEVAKAGPKLPKSISIVIPHTKWRMFADEVGSPTRITVGNVDVQVLSDKSPAPEDRL